MAQWAAPRLPAAPRRDSVALMAVANGTVITSVASSQAAHVEKRHTVAKRAQTLRCFDDAAEQVAAVRPKSHREAGYVLARAVQIAILRPSRNPTAVQRLTNA
jgi:hypothetical protein